MAAAVPAEVPVARLSLDQYHRMIEAAVFGEDDRIELIEGVLVAMSPQSTMHVAIVEFLGAWFYRHLGGRARVRTQMPLTLLASGSEPEPDLAIVAHPLSVAAHPTTALLVVEVAVSSHAADRAKLAGYAAAGVIEVWIVDVPGERLLVHRRPVDGVYEEIRALGPGETVDVAAFGDLAIAVDEVLHPTPA